MSDRRFVQPSRGAPQEVDESVMEVYVAPGPMAPAMYNPQVPPPNFKIPLPPLPPSQLQPQVTHSAPVPVPQGIPAAFVPTGGPTIVPQSHMAALTSVQQIMAPTTLPIRQLSHSEGYMIQAPMRMPLAPQQSLPSILGSKKRIIIQDDFGVDRTHMVDERTMRNIRSLVENAEQNEQHMASAIFGPQQQSLALQASMGSLPSAGSNYSSAGLLTSAYNTVVPSVDPAVAIHEHYQALVQMGRTQDINQLLHEMGVSLHHQQQQLPYQQGHVQFPEKVT